MAKLKHKTAAKVSKEKRQSTIQQAKDECTRRIEQQWDMHGQLNVALGIYDKETQDKCKDYIKHHRKKLDDLIKAIENSEDPKAIDVTGADWWE